MADLIGLLREQIGLKDELISALQREASLLTRQMQEIEDQLKKDSFDGSIPSLVRFSRPPKSARKKSSKKRG